VVTLVLGIAMFGIGLFIALRPLWKHNATLTGARWMDWAFAFVFMLRGVMNWRTARGRRTATFARR
jgi:hypothetical protein